MSTAIQNIAVYTFADCVALKSMVLPASLTTIEANAFSGCISLECVTIPANVTNIGSYAFEGCVALNSAVFEKSTGWKAGTTAIELPSVTTAAEYLSITYSDKAWTRS